MDIFKSCSALENQLKKFKKNHFLIGFVPTMGALHKGHISLVERSVQENDFTIVSIFINPTQFNNEHDLKTYPNNLKKDIFLLKNISNKIIVFNPTVKEIYSGNIKRENFKFQTLVKHMEGKYRPGHFMGVATIINKLFSIISADKVYFGEKDFQQIRVIEHLTNNRKFSVKIIRCKTVRHRSGLAYSSRNSKLDYSSKKIAANLFKALNFAKQNFEKFDIIKINSMCLNIISKYPEINVEYFTIADENNLIPAKQKQKGVKYRAFIAAYVFGVRLIDNLELN